MATVLRIANSPICRVRWSDREPCGSHLSGAGSQHSERPIAFRDPPALVIKLSALMPYVVVADGVVGVYRTASSVKAVIPTFETWVAYDVTGWRVELTRGRTWRRWEIEIGVFPRLMPVAEPPALDAVRELLATALDRPSSIRDGSSLRATIYRFAAHIGWRDDDPSNCVPVPRTVEHFGGT
jgi:hypothetical protein